MTLIDADKFLAYLIFSKHIDELTCGEVKQAIEMCKVDVLDKIKAEIEQLTSRYSISKERDGMGHIEWSDRLIKESDVLKIIDKHKEESEEAK